MSDIVDFIAQGDTDLRPALERAVAEIERLKAALQHHQNNAIGMMRVATENERLRALLHRWYVLGHDLAEETLAALEGKT